MQELANQSRVTANRQEHFTNGRFAFNVSEMTGEKADMKYLKYRAWTAKKNGVCLTPKKKDEPKPKRSYKPKSAQIEKDWHKMFIG